MTVSLQQRFESFADQYKKFEHIPAPRHPRPDVCAYLLLHELVPGAQNMVSAAVHDEVYLSVDCGELHQAATDAHIEELVRCGVRYIDDFDCLGMFV